MREIRTRSAQDRAILKVNPTLNKSVDHRSAQVEQKRLSDETCVAVRISESGSRTRAQTSKQVEGLQIASHCRKRALRALKDWVETQR